MSEWTIVWCIYLCIFSQGIDCKSGLPLDEFVQTCDAFILLNNSHLEIVPETQWAFKELETWSMEIPSLAVNTRWAEEKREACQSKLSFFYNSN